MISTRKIFDARYQCKKTPLFFTLEACCQHANIANRYQRNFDKILALADDIKSIAEKHKATAAQVCLAWLLGQGDEVFVIPGTKKVEVSCKSIYVSCSTEHFDGFRLVVPEGERRSESDPLE